MGPWMGHTDSTALHVTRHVRVDVETACDLATPTTHTSMSGRRSCLVLVLAESQLLDVVALDGGRHVKLRERRLNRRR